MNARYQEGGSNKNEERDEECCHVQQDNQRDVEFHWCRADVVVSRVELDETIVLLQQDDTDADDITPK